MKVKIIPEFLIDLTDGTVSLNFDFYISFLFLNHRDILLLTRLFIGYYRNLTNSDNENSYFQTYNMGLAVFLTIFACFLLTGIIIVRK